MKRPRRVGNKFYNPDSSKKVADKWAVKSQYGHLAPIELPVCLSIIYSLPIPKSYSKKKSQILIHSKKPDIDNLIKHTLDVLSGLIIKDDALVYRLSAVKTYGKTPMTQIEVEIATCI